MFVRINICFIIVGFYHCSSIQINFIKVPMAVRNNSGEEVILDCDYSLRPDDDDLAVKWYLNEEVVYQWIPPRKPQSLGKLKDKVDLTFKATNDPKTVYRAMKITNPTSEIAGEYKCFVSTFTDEDFSAKQMIIFESEKTLTIEQTTDGKNINFTCSATEVYPIPKLILFKDKKDDFHNRNPLKTMQWDTTRTPSGRFSVYIIATGSFETVAPGSLIHCELRISGTAYIKRKTLLYYPEERDIQEAADTSSINLLPEKSKEKQYVHFLKWCKDKKVKSFKEEVVSAYIVDLHELLKPNIYILMI